jgi:hypothetical protein
MIGDQYANLEEAVAAVEETIARSARAGTFGFVSDSEGNVTDVGTD